jgi:hypothetical protein
MRSWAWVAALLWTAVPATAEPLRTFPPVELLSAGLVDSCTTLVDYCLLGRCSIQNLSDRVHAEVEVSLRLTDRTGRAWTRTTRGVLPASQSGWLEHAFPEATVGLHGYALECSVGEVKPYFGPLPARR